jgi:hypothetical protein
VAYVTGACIQSSSTSKGVSHCHIHIYIPTLHLPTPFPPSFRKYSGNIFFFSVTRFIVSYRFTHCNQNRIRI